MARVTLQDGDIFTDVAANAAGFPILDGEDTYGHGDKIIDDWLSDDPDGIKARFYSWLNRVQIEVTTGRIVSYSGASVLLADGSTATISAGTLTLPANSTRFIFISEVGQVSHAVSLPALGVPLAKATTDASDVTNLDDIRYQAVEQVTPLTQGEASPGLSIGDIKETASQVLDPGWFPVDRTVSINLPITLKRSHESGEFGVFQVTPLILLGHHRTTLFILQLDHV